MYSTPNTTKPSTSNFFETTQPSNERSYQYQAGLALASPIRSSREKITRDTTKLSAFSFLDAIKSAVGIMVGTGDYRNSEFDPNNRGWKKRSRLPNIQPSSWKFPIEITSVRDRKTNELLSSTYLPSSIRLETFIGNTRAYSAHISEEVASLETTYTPIHCEINRKYKGSLLLEFEKTHGTKRRIQLLVPLREGVNIEFEKIELKVLERKVRQWIRSLTPSTLWINDCELLSYGTYITDIANGWFFLEKGDAIQAIEFIDGKMKRSHFEITYLSPTKTPITVRRV